MLPGHESTDYYFHYCNCYNGARISLNDLNSVDRTLLNLSDLSLVNDFMNGFMTPNTFILNSSIKYILNSERFSGCLF